MQLLGDWSLTSCLRTPINQVWPAEKPNGGGVFWNFVGSKEEDFGKSPVIGCTAPPPSL